MVLVVVGLSLPLVMVEYVFATGREQRMLMVVGAALVSLFLLGGSVQKKKKKLA